MGAALKHPGVHFALLLLIAVILRCDTFGDPNLHGDESFYRTVGEAMHRGALPYVDVWDRKPFGLFALYWLIAVISTAPLAYQLVATLFAAATAATIAAIARRWVSPSGALLAGAIYLLWLAPMQGYGGQSPVFYNFFTAAAAFLVLGALPQLKQGIVPRSVLLAMLLAGASITVKTSAFAEAAFLGLLCAAALLRSAMPRGQALARTGLWALIGAAPALLIAVAYWLSGHWEEYWHAMVTSNLAKGADAATGWLRFRLMLVQLVPVLAIAAFGLLDQPREARRFLGGWLIAALLGLVIVPNFYPHYALPLLVPLCTAASAFLARGAVGRIAVAAIAALSLYIHPIFQFEHSQRSRSAMAELVQAVQLHNGGGGLFVYDGPSQLYALTGQPFVTPLVFPTHLSHGIEKDVSHLSTLGEVQRVLAARPGVVVRAAGVRNAPQNEETKALVVAYALASCQHVAQVLLPERTREDWIEVWGDCKR